MDVGQNIALPMDQQNAGHVKAPKDFLKPHFM